jgi:3,4-dihydroxy-2-butanone 4-phosphate synthase/GTP cyclohydrolase II
MAKMLETSSLTRVASTRMPTKWGLFKATGYVQDLADGNGSAAVAIMLGDPTTVAAPLVRIHAQCFTGEILGSLRCDCSEQFAVAMQAIADEGCGLVIYEYQEGRGIGLMAKLQAYELQDYGLDTIEANHALGFDADYRDYQLPIAILRDLGIDRVRLLSNSPDKARALSEAGITVAARVPCEGSPNVHSHRYLTTKKERLGHTLTLARNDTIASHAVQTSGFVTVELAIRGIKAGRIVVVVDDEHRENEGDLIVAAEKVTPEAINFMATHGRGLVCLAMTGERLDRLQLGPMVPDNGALGGTAFTVSIDARGEGMTTGISTHERARTIKAAVAAKSKAADFAPPGHVFPLRARAGGVLERRGHTEAAVDLARLAGFTPAGVICEIVNDDGTMARVEDLVRFCSKHRLTMISVADLVKYRLVKESECVEASQILQIQPRERVAASVSSP